MIRAFCTILLLIASVLGYTQNPNKSSTVKLVSDFIKFDGIPDDLAWEKTGDAKDLQQYFPPDKVLAESMTV